MKHIYTLFIIIITLAFCTERKEKITLVQNQSSDYTIIVSESADSLTQSAAHELRTYIFKVSGANLKIANGIGKSNKLIIIGKELLNDSMLVELDSIKEDGFIIRANDGNIIISGNEGKTNLYATYTFIDEFLGCRLLSSTEEYVSRNKTIDIPEINKTYEPAFSFRRTLFPGQKSAKYRYWHKIETLEEWGSFVHTFDDLIPPGRYFEKHPEYFSLNGGHRLSDGQLCLSNPEVITTLIENLKKEIEKNPDKKYWSVSQNDCYNYCECEKCNEMYQKYGSVSGAYIFMANKIAKVFPEKQISTLAYQFTRSAPTNIKPSHIGHQQAQI